MAMVIFIKTNLYALAGMDKKGGIMKSIFLIDPTNTERKLKIMKTENTYESTRKFIGNTLTIAASFETSEIYAKESGIVAYDVYSDDEGLINDPDCFFSVKCGDRVTQPIAGRGVIHATNSIGESVEIDPNWVILNLSFSMATKNEPEQWNKIRNLYLKVYGDAYGIEEL